MTVETAPEVIDSIVPPRAPLLRFMAGSLAGIEFVVDGPEVVLGRSSDCHVRLDAGVELLVSGRHARLIERDGAWWLEDLQSTNGTFVNGDRVNDERRIDPDDEVHLGPPDADGSCSFAFVVLHGRPTTVLLEPVPELTSAAGSESPAGHAPGGGSEGVREVRRVECPWCGWAGPPAPSESGSRDSVPAACPACGIPPPGFSDAQDKRWLAPWGIGSGEECDRLVGAWVRASWMTGRVPEARPFDSPGQSAWTRLRVRVARMVLSWMSSAVRCDLAARRAVNASRLRLAVEGYARANPLLLEEVGRRSDPEVDPASAAGVWFEVLLERIPEDRGWLQDGTAESTELAAALDEAAVLWREWQAMRAGIGEP